VLLQGKRGLILGVANKWSIAWGIVQSVTREGARLALTYQGQRLEENVRDLAASLDQPVILPCDVTRDEDLDALAASVKQELGGLDFVVHAVAFAQREELDGEFMNTSREGYRIAQDISSYSLTALTRRVAPLMESGGSILTLSYLGGERVVPHYNVMSRGAPDGGALRPRPGPTTSGERTISAGHRDPLAASGVKASRCSLPGLRPCAECSAGWAMRRSS
jgi:enoyl-[acyl-carrier protein] reductase I